MHVFISRVFICGAAGCELQVVVLVMFATNEIATIFYTSLPTGNEHFNSEATAATAINARKRVRRVSISNAHARGKLIRF